MQWKVVKVKQGKKFHKRLEKAITKIYEKGFRPDIIDLECGLLIARRDEPSPTLQSMLPGLMSLGRKSDVPETVEMNSGVTAPLVSKVISVMSSSPTEAQGMQFAQMTMKLMLNNCSKKELHTISDDIARIVDGHEKSHVDQNVDHDDCSELKFIKVAQQLVNQYIESKPAN